MAKSDLARALAALTVLLVAASVPAPARADDAPTRLRLLASARLPYVEQVVFDDGAKVAYTVGDDKLFVVDLSPAALALESAPANPGEGTTLPVLQTVPLGRAVNDVATCGRLLALSVNGPTKVDPGSVRIHRRYEREGADSLKLLATFTVGALPDQLEFSKDCKTLLVSNEAEPSSYPSTPTTDPEGSVSIIRLRISSGATSVTGSVRTANFNAWDSRRDELVARGIKLNGPGASVSQDLEPEYSTFSADEEVAFVSLQENNAIAVLNIEEARFTGIYPLGFKDHSKPANVLDASDRDNAINIAAWPVEGLFMPDEIKAFRHRGADYVVTANEGDARDWTGLAEEARGGALNRTAFPPEVASLLANNSALGRLTLIGAPFALNDRDADGRVDRLLAYGARSFSIWRLDNRGNRRQQLSQVFDSASQLEQISARELPALFNSEGVSTGSSGKDTRSDNKGPEPEGVAIGPCATGGRDYDGYSAESDDARRCLFLTAERLGAVFVFDISDPRRPAYQSLVLPPQSDSGNEATRLRAPEGITYAAYSLPKGRSVPLVLVAYEGSGGNFAGIGVFKVTV